ncbi:MAG: hypothetical protein V4812_16035 [Pseudomonadota bacterium]
MNAARTFRRLLLWPLAAILGLTLVAYLGLLLLNWRDEPPSVGALQLDAIYRERAVPADADNAYPYLMGFTAAAGQDPTEQGLKRIAWAREALQQPWTDELVEPERDHFIDFPSMRSPSLRVLLQSCTHNEPGCTPGLLADGNLVERWLASEALLLERYSGLLRHSAYFEPLPYDPRLRFPEYQQVLDGQRLLLIRAWWLARQGEEWQVRQLLEDDLSFWRMALANADLLIVKMVASTAIKQHFFWGNRALKQLPAAQALGGIPQSWQQPLTFEERSLLRAAGGELMFVERYIKQIAQGQVDWVAGYGASSSMQRALMTLGAPFLLVQATSNRQAQFLLDLEQAFAVPYAQLEQARERATQLRRLYRPEPLRLAHLYNLMGNVLHAQKDSHDYYSDYFLRAAELEGIRQTALLLATLRSQGSTGATLEAAVQQAALRNPYNQKPFDWDADTGTLGFPSPGRDEVYRLEY